MRLNTMGKVFKDSKEAILKRGMRRLGKQSVKTAKEVTKATGSVLGTSGKVVGSVMADNSIKFMKGTVNAASHLVREDKKNSLIGLKFKKRGFALVAGASMIGATAKEAKSYVQDDLRGRVDSQTTPIAPRLNIGGYQDFGQQAGATGDLVFALNKNRRG